MGVSIMIKTPKGKEINITPGGRSSFHALLDDERLDGILDKSDLDRVLSLALANIGEFRDSLVAIAYHITKYDHIIIDCEF